MYPSTTYPPPCIFTSSSPIPLPTAVPVGSSVQINVAHFPHPTPHQLLSLHFGPVVPVSSMTPVRPLLLFPSAPLLAPLVSTMVSSAAPLSQTPALVQKLRRLNVDPPTSTTVSCLNPMYVSVVYILSALNNDKILICSSRGGLDKAP